MVSIHKVPAVVLLIIRVIYFIFRFKRGVTSFIVLEALVNLNAR